ncbi:hypothetical protein PFLUV_G00182310 [Perca fluviatilis]|uniref:Uncharacterized protein n=1 Tax=Perca fluviatilis TaxID=8168 RepID=A0A6A5EMB5_PERFL|nr:TRIO and F-actin-binding protein-like isoform X2 [Perca fluviatilis]KAF1380035.1 hypothetical protein PFLUV_G00182310 [Perca fluviatilis]
MNRGTKRPKGGAKKKREKTSVSQRQYSKEIIEKMFRFIFGRNFFARPRSSGDMDSSSKKSKRRGESPSSPEDLNPPTILREHGRRGERPSSSGGTNPSTTMKEHRERGEGPFSCAENQPSTTRQQERRDVSSLFIVGTNPSAIMMESRQRSESSLSSSSEDDEPSTTRQRVRRFDSPSSSSSEEKQPSTPRRQQAWRGGSPSSSSSEDDQPSTTRQQVRRDVSSLFIVGTNPSIITKESRQRGESSLSSSSEDDEPSTTRQRVRRFESPSSSYSEEKQQAWRGESPSLSSSEDDQCFTTRLLVRRFESPSSSSSEDDQRCTTRLLVRRDVSSLFIVGTNPSTTMKESRQRGESSLSSSSEDDEPFTTRQRVRRFESPSSSSSEDKQPTARRRQQARRAESTLWSSSEDDEPSTTRRQQQQSPLSFVDINLPTTFRQNGGIGENHLPYVDIDQPSIWWEHVRRGERPSFRGDFNPSNTLRQDGQSGDSPSSTSSSSEDDEPLTTRKQRDRRANSPLSLYLSARKRLEEEGLKRERERCEEMKRKNQEKERTTFGLRSRLYIWWLNRKIERIAREIQSTFVDECYLLRHDPLRNPEKMAEKERLLDRRRELVVYKRRQELKVEREVMKQKLLRHNSEIRHMLNLRNEPMPVRSRKLVNVKTYPNLALVKFWQRP